MAGQILVCDDQIHVSKLVELTLRRDGYEVASCTSAEAAWHHIQNRMPDLLICDCQTSGLSGLELCRQIRLSEEWNLLPVILLTARGFQLSEERLQRDLNVAAIVHKPFSPRELRARVSSVLGEPARAT